MKYGNLIFLEPSGPLLYLLGDVSVSLNSEGGKVFFYVSATERLIMNDVKYTDF